MILGDLFRANDEKVFKITGMEIKDNDPWVTYINTQTEQEFSCRQEAFLSRFSPLPQSR
jgi:hypothetical protein